MNPLLFISASVPPGGDLTEGFLRYGFGGGGLYLEGLIFILGGLIFGILRYLINVVSSDGM